MASDPRWVGYLLLLLGFSAQARSFAYAGIGLNTDLKAVAARYPHSTFQGSYVHLAPEDIHDHISVVEVSGSGASRRVRVAFELQRPDGTLDYPRCSVVEAELVGTYGSPREIRRFSEEASPRADRIWQSKTEVMTLICFKGAGGTYLAEAVQISPR
jgi:hypothetical protein